MGAPEGDPADLPPELEFDDSGAWTLGEPDVVVTTDEFLVKEGVTAMVIPGYKSRAAVLFQSDHGSHEPGHPLPPPSVALMPLTSPSTLLPGWLAW